MTNIANWNDRITKISIITNKGIYIRTDVFIPSKGWINLNVDLHTASTLSKGMKYETLVGKGYIDN